MVLLSVDLDWRVHGWPIGKKVKRDSALGWSGLLFAPVQRDK
jgi:hypothetical protein